MAIEEIHVGDIGTAFELTIHDTVDGVTTVLPVGAATTKTITFLTADDTTVVKPATFVTDGTDGKIQYITVADDLNIDGPWKIQGKVTLPAGTWSTDISTFKVWPNL